MNINAFLNKINKVPEKFVQEDFSKYKGQSIKVIKGNYAGMKGKILREARNRGAGVTMWVNLTSNRNLILDIPLEHLEVLENENK